MALAVQDECHRMKRSDANMAKRNVYSSKWQAKVSVVVCLLNRARVFLYWQCMTVYCYL